MTAAAAGASLLSDFCHQTPMSLLPGQTEHKYITPICAPYPGYGVVIPHPERLGEYVRKNFCGKRKAQDEYLQAALAWRDQTYRELYKREVSQRVFHRTQANSTTDTPGVRRMEKVVKKKLKDGTFREYRVPCIMAEIFTIPGKDYKRARGSKSKIYSIAKYGEETAMKLAKEWRRNMELSLFIAEDMKAMYDSMTE
ncbi:hypothetical protein EGT07_23810 [Herbaspirillum sp. HC18]|nr:hypothetical protein EGT07_23810 [Herbaspirillum sp. HC18]